MPKNLNRGRRKALAGLSSLLGAAPLAALAQQQQGRPSRPQPPLHAGFVYVSPIGDAGWTYQHDQGRLAMERALGDRVRTSVVENVAEGPDAERVMRDLARQGCKLIFATSFGYGEPALRVAADFPDVAFEHAGGFKTAQNLGTYNARYYEGRYLAGLVAGRSSRKGTAGYVAGFPLPEVIQGINAFALGMREANPRAIVKVVWLNAWFDPPREREAAVALINQGADVIANHSGSTAVAQVCEERNVGFTAYQSDMRRIAPKAQWTAVVSDWGGWYAQVAESLLAGTWRPDPVWGGMRDGFLRLAPLGPRAAPEAALLVAARERQMAAGSLHPFSGRLVDNEGRQRQARGTMTDADIARMSWFVEGVVGSVPRA